MKEDSKERITITIDRIVLARVDGVADARGDSRSAVIERIVSNGIGSEERFLAMMEVPATRLIIEKIVGSPAIAGAIAQLVGESLSKEELKALNEEARKQAERGIDRRKAKRVTREGLLREGA